jgi:DNA primase
MNELDGIEIETPDYKIVYDLIKREFADGRVHDDKFYTANEDEKIAAIAINIVAERYKLSDNWWNKHKVAIPEKRDTFVKDIHSVILKFKKFKNHLELNKITERIKQAKDEAELIRLMKLHKLLTEQKVEFSNTIGNVIYKPSI